MARALLGNSGLPGPLTRLGRARPVVVGLALLATTAVAVGSMGEITMVRLTEEVNANWRGAYDILVRPRLSRLDLEITRGLVEPNFLGFSGRGGISFAQVDAIRAIPEVELAAPVSVVGHMSYTASAPIVCVSPLPDRPTLFEVDATLLTSDGLADIPLQRQTGKLLIGPNNGLDDFRRWASGLSPAISGTPTEGDFGLGYLPPIESPLVAVDPRAELALLGPSASFLESFERLDSPEPTTRTFDLSLVSQGFELAREDLRAAGARRERPVVPLAVSETLYAPLALRVRLERIGAPLPSWDPIPGDGDTRQKLAAAEAAAGSGQFFVGETTLDATRSLRPFVPPPLTIVAPGFRPLPGHCLPSYEVATPTLREVSLTLRPDYSIRSPRVGSLDPTFTIASKGVVNAEAAQVEPQDPANGVIEPGLEPAYRVLRSYPLEVAHGFRPDDPYDQPFYFAPIATFDLDRLDRPANPLTYVPLGAYDPPATDFVARPDGRPASKPSPMHPTLNPAGLITVPPLAITNLEAARLLRGETPIDAIRVRVSGLSDFGPEARAKVERVASRIAELGLDVDIVAGSSPQPVEIYVPAYRLGTWPPEDLGFVRQGWTTLGAAERVERGLGETNLALLLLALGSAAIFTVGLQLSQLTTRAQEVAILEALGWGSRRILGWYGSEAVSGGGFIALVGLAAWLVGPRSVWAVMATIALALLLPAAGVVTTLAVLRGTAGRTPGAADVWRGAPTGRIGRVSGLTSYAVRTLIARPVRSATIIGALGFGAAALSLSAVLVGQTAARVGPTLLASALSDTLRPHQLALLSLAGLGGVLLTAVLLGVDLADRRQELLVLRGAGWTRRALLTLVLRERAGVGLAAAVLAAVLAGLTAGAVLGASGLLPAALAAAIAKSVVVWGAIWRLPDESRA